jgi:hypothetical protein
MLLRKWTGSEQRARTDDGILVFLGGPKFSSRLATKNFREASIGCSTV